MKRKLPALVLALAIVISAFGLVPAAAASTDSNTELAMAVLEGLGAFDDGEMTSSDTITRGEFARLLAYALGKGSEASSYEPHNVHRRPGRQRQRQLHQPCKQRGRPNRQR